ncbi:hypothetical protein MYSTI_00192 [Myxococcus stipitatus DSM 14675]|uniref:Uncharacterized protein n=1 Tax=Myxococcus stipitatus (strain DSM 14675 / JCM 12634 / Mx s8) TaxID=1278073 RepID=L7TYF8_MYXSD|nr:hypothetical protein [Myxococcus stipitatus]AGC41551.1 hypothetical protein MYSTI_00192 [Myxococcus stipitatus DSM 14675]
MAQKVGEHKSRGSSRARSPMALVTRGVEAEGRGALALRRTTSEYRAAAEEQAARVREEIEAALVVARDTREAIERRIASELHAPPVPPGGVREQAPRRKALRRAHPRKVRH